jgi:hypothetical protein
MAVSSLCRSGVVEPLDALSGVAFVGPLASDVLDGPQHVSDVLADTLALWVTGRSAAVIPFARHEACSPPVTLA